MFNRRPASLAVIDPLCIAFLEKEYLSRPYIVPGELESALQQAASDLQRRFGEFSCLVNVGSTSNGSLALRQQQGDRHRSDLDFYLVGYQATASDLFQMNRLVEQSVRPLGLTLDGVLNGANPAYYLNLSDIPKHIADGDFNLLALPFQSAFGNALDAQVAVVEAILQSDQPESIWEEVAGYQIQSLSMHHGTFGKFNDTIFHDYYPRKIAAFQLPGSPELALTLLGQGVRWDYSPHDATPTITDDDSVHSIGVDALTFDGSSASTAKAVRAALDIPASSDVRAELDQLARTVHESSIEDPSQKPGGLDFGI